MTGIIVPKERIEEMMDRANYVFTLVKGSGITLCHSFIDGHPIAYGTSSHSNTGNPYDEDRGHDLALQRCKKATQLAIYNHEKYAYKFYTNKAADDQLEPLNGIRGYVPVVDNGVIKHVCVHESLVTGYDEVLIIMDNDVFDKYVCPAKVWLAKKDVKCIGVEDEKVKYAELLDRLVKD